jgi:hypothetical protein
MLPIEKLNKICDEIFERWDKDQRSGKLLTALAGRLQKYRPDVDEVRRALQYGPTEDREIILALFAPQTEHADGCLFKTSGLCCQCGFSEVVGRYRWALRRAKEIATDHYGSTYDAREPALTSAEGSKAP